MNKFILFISVILSLGTLGCQQGGVDVISITQVAAPFYFQASYVSPAKMALRHCENDDERCLDSLQSFFRKSISIQVKVGVKNNPDNSNPLVGNTGTYLKYKELIDELYFESEDAFVLKADDEIIVPVLAVAEDYQGLRPDNVINLVFPMPTKNLNQLSTLTLVYDDQIFDAGLLSFEYDVSSITKKQFQS